MAIKRNSSAKDSIKKKVKKLDIEETVDYTKLLTAEDVEIIESGDEQELSIANKPQKINSAKRAQALKKKLSKTDKDNGVSKKTKGNPITTTGIHLLIFINCFFFFFITIKFYRQQTYRETKLERVQKRKTRTSS